MGYIATTSATANIDAVLTRDGRRILASSTEQFNITQWAVADDEINYQLMTDVTNIDNTSQNLLSLPIPEPSTNSAVELINKVWVNNTFLDQQFAASSVQTAQKVILATSKGDVGMLYSDDTSNSLSIFIGTLSPIGRPFVAPFYSLTFNSNYDFFNITFTEPPLTSQINNNWTKVNQYQYTFTAANADSSGTYTHNHNGSPAVVFVVQLVMTPLLLQQLALPSNRSQIYIPNFLTVTQVDAAGAPDSTVSPATLPLSVINVL